jgi:D-glutamate cyclase
MTDNSPFFAELEMLIHRDPGGRGLGEESCRGPFSLTRGNLQRASAELFDHGARIALITGFTIPDATPPAPETDGPPGALQLARVLSALERTVCVLCDERTAVVLLPLLRDYDIEQETIPYSADDGPLAKEEAQRWSRSFLETFAPTHLVSIEHVGPSYSQGTIPTAHRDRFMREIPLAAHDRCQSMSGVILGALAAPAYQLFLEASSEVVTIAIGDGGNEIGMGSLPWDVLADNISNGLGGQIACRIPCGHLIVSGVSNWGAYALASAVNFLGEGAKGRVNIPEQAAILERLLAAGAIDGVLKEKQLSVDGLPWSVHKDWLEQLVMVLARHQRKVRKK